MAYLLPNEVYNQWTMDIFCAYSGPNLAGGKWDVWHVGRLTPDHYVGTKDIDYIRAAVPGVTLIVRGDGDVITSRATSPEWMKVRQLSKVWISSDKKSGDPRFGLVGALNWNFINGSPPRNAMDEAAMYDGKDEEAGRGTKATKAAIDEWEDKLRAGQIESLDHLIPTPPRYRR